MRKDKGLNGDLDRLPMLTWIMFLKFLDDMEQIDAKKKPPLRGNAFALLLSRRIAGVIGLQTQAGY